MTNNPSTFAAGADGTVFGPLRHSVRRSDLVAIGGEADIARPSQIGRL